MGVVDNMHTNIIYLLTCLLILLQGLFVLFQCLFVYVVGLLDTLTLLSLRRFGCSSYITLSILVHNCQSQLCGEVENYVYALYSYTCVYYTLTLLDGFVIWWVTTCLWAHYILLLINNKAMQLDIYTPIIVICTGIEVSGRVSIGIWPKQMW